MLRRLLPRALLAMVCLAAAAVAARAQETPQAAQGALIVQPDQLVASTAGGCAPWSPCVITYTVTLRATEDVTGVVPVAADLFHEGDAPPFPASAITTATGPGALTPTSVVPLTVTLDLAGAGPGSYVGKLWLTYDGGVADLPLTVRVRHWWLPAFLTLLAAVVGGMWFNQYRDRHRPRDELIIKLDAIGRRVEGEDNLAPAFRRYVDQQIAVARSALQLSRPDEAQTALAAAESAWHRWVVHRVAWRELDASIAALRAALAGAPRLPVNSPLSVSLGQTLDQSERELALSDDPEATRQRLKGVRAALAAFRTLRERIGALSELDPEAPALEGLRSAEAELLALTGEDLAAVQAIQARLDAEQGSYDEALRAAQEAATVLGGGEAGEDILIPKGVPGSPVPLPELGVADADAISADPRADARRARWRRRLFTLASLLLILVGLLPLGFTELYLNKPVFGANPWADYPALVFWGLGIEFTRQTILGLVGRPSEAAS